MRRLRKLATHILAMRKDEHFLEMLETVVDFVAKILSVALLIVILVAIFDLIVFLCKELFSEPIGFLNKTLLQIFGVFLNILIAIELLDNITAYLRKHIFQVELVLVTSLIAVARKIIIFDLEKKSSEDLIALAIAILCLSIGFCLVKLINREN